jgi:predicted DNA-binding transcriptional regulator AlpA
MLRLDEKMLEAGVYSFRDLQSLGYVKDRSDLHRKQKRYSFPKTVKLGDRAEVHSWVRERVATSRK